MAYRDTSIVIPVLNEPADAVQQLVSTVLMDQDVNDVWVITAGPGIDQSLAVNERLRVRSQPGTGKADALNYGLSMAHSPYTLFLDADVILKGDEISIAREVLEGKDIHFVSCGYGSRPPAFPIAVGMGGWFSGCRTNTFRQLGGWEENPLEDVVTSAKIKRAGYKITPLPFAVSVRRAPRNPGTKFLSALTSFGRR
jgi:cellulose synthase/poly-beta-1,6-N-acetylglucosamine synthase-like glycosyltransferase